MKLIDESYSSNKSNKTLLIAGIIGIVLLLVIIISLLVFVVVTSANTLSLLVNNKKATQCLLDKENVMYVGIEDLTQYLGDGYTYKSGTKTGEDDNKCYITNSNIMESTFFEVGSSNIYKIQEDSNETEYYKLDSPIIKENGKIYMPINSVNTALNAVLVNNKNKYSITTIEAIEAKYNKTKSKTFLPDESIVWNTLPSNKKLLKKGLVITKDSNGLMGVAKVNTSYNKKTKITSVYTDSIIDQKYDYIKYIEKYNELIVESNGKRGIIKLGEENGNITRNTLVSLQYDDIKPITEELFLVTDNTSEKDKKYGIVKATDGTEEQLLSIEYEKIGVDLEKFPNNDLTSEFLLYDSIIPVKKDNLWGFVNLKGKIVANFEYSTIGCVGNNANNNVLIIPERNAIVVKRGEKYGIITKSNTLITKFVFDKVYKTTVDGNNKYFVDIGGKEYNAIDYINNPSKYN